VIFYMVGFIDLLTNMLLQNFNPPIEIMTRLMRIVFEIAACNFKDHLPKSEDSGETVLSKVQLTSSQQDFDSLGLDENCMLFMKSILLRKQYGGMAWYVTSIHSVINI